MALIVFAVISACHNQLIASSISGFPWVLAGALITLAAGRLPRGEFASHHF